MTPLNSDSHRQGQDVMSDDNGDETMKQKFEEDTQNAKREAGAKAQAKAEEGQRKVADETDALSDAIDAAASSLDDHDREGLARYARELSSQLSNAAGQLEGRSVDELASDAKRLARDNPALFMLGSISVGFGLSRFFKASAERDRHADENPERRSDKEKDDDVWNGMPSQGGSRDMREPNTSSSVPHNGNGSDML